MTTALMKFINCIPAHQDDANLDMKPSNYVDPKIVVEGEAKERAQIYHTSADKKFVAGIWECTACIERLIDYPADEFMTVLSGSVTLSDLDGNNPQTYSKGQSFVMPKGWNGLWAMKGTFRKYFIMYLN
ncbi:cupin domain-containing protein [Leisingera daeponensis]|uniref:cupin domain-containing protein n=1 Tax=Leisingera daeponensis TaxID=405746 RepID=UPI001C94DEDA|nr:cupin domain-containing protein [Leisingera daeponensis]MBY6058754.1 DUF861 domain-containing protein [Leisingera daeponensis]